MEEKKARVIGLDELVKGRRYRVQGVNGTQPEYAAKLYKMGFVKGTEVQLAPVALRDPLVIEIRGSRIALRRDEARQIFVEEAL